MVCCCSSPQCAKYGCQSWANIQPPANYQQIQTGSRPHKCPVCDGKSEKEWYEDNGLSRKVQKCKACINGIVWG